MSGVIRSSERLALPKALYTADYQWSHKSCNSKCSTGNNHRRHGIYRLTDSFPYLVNRVGVRVGEVFSRQLEQHGITLPMYRVMAALWVKGDQRLGDLAEATSSELSTLSRLIGTMARKDIVSRQRLFDNGRTVEINLTGLGRTLAQRLIPMAEQHEVLALRGFTSAERERLKADLVRIFDNLVGHQDVATPDKT